MSNLLFLKKTLFTIAFFAVFILFTKANNIVPNTTKPFFIENKGQIQDTKGLPLLDILFKASIKGFDIYITKKGLSYVLHSAQDSMVTKSDRTKKFYAVNRIDMELEGADISVLDMVKEKESADYYNFFIGDFKYSATKIKKYEKLTFKNVYPGIDWVWYINDKNSVKYEFVVHPGANPSIIKMKYEWAKININKKGDLVIYTPLNSLIESNLISFNNGKAIKTKFNLAENKNEVTYALSNYDKTKDLIIDPPLKLLWGTFDGGIGTDVLYACCVDNMNNFYTTGCSSSIDFPTKNLGGAYFYYDTVYTNGSVVLQKFNSNRQLVWSTFFGGCQQDIGFSVHADQTGNILLTGRTESLNYPIVTPSGAYSQLGGGVLIAKFNLSGALTWSTGFGGGFIDEGYRINTDKNDNIFVSGYTGSSNFKIFSSTIGAYQQSDSGHSYQAFILKFSNAGTLLWSTTLGGTHDEGCLDLAFDSNNNVYMVGYTSSTDFPILQEGVNSYYKQNAHLYFYDAFITKFDNDGILKWSTCFGGYNNEMGVGIAIDNADNLYISGTTISTDLPVKNPGGGAYYKDTISSSWNSDIFIAEFDTSKALSWSTYYGGTGEESGYNQCNGGCDYQKGPAIEIDPCGSIFVGGTTASSDFPFKSGGLAAFAGGTIYTVFDNNFMLAFNNKRQSKWSIFFGTQGVDYLNDITIDNSGNVFAVGTWENSGCTAVKNPGGGAFFQDTSKYGFGDGAIMEFEGYDKSVLVATKNINCAGENTGQAAATINNDTTGYVFSWSTNPIETGSSVSNLPTGDYTVTAVDTINKCFFHQSFSIIEPPALVAKVNGNDTLCPNINDTFSVNVSGGVKPYAFTWNNASINQSQIVNISSPNTYYVLITDSNGCKKTSDTLNVWVYPKLNFLTSIDTSVCPNYPVRFQVNPIGGDGHYSFNWNTNFGNSAGLFVSKSDSTTIYYCTVTDGCTQSLIDTIRIYVYPKPKAQFSCPDKPFNSGDVINFDDNSTGAISWNWNFGDESTSFLQNVSHPFYSSTYDIYLLVSNVYGCKDSTHCKIYLIEDLIIPNIFSPNGDLINDNFEIKSSGIISFTMIVYDRWGNKIFGTNNIEQFWDGTYNGKKVSEGTYFYIIEAKSYSGKIFDSKGFLTLVK